MFSGLGTQEMVLLGVIALMLFGSRLPEIARKLGGTYRDMRKKVDDFQREFRDWDKVDDSPAQNLTYSPPDEDKPQRKAPTTPKFTPPPADDD